MEQLILHGIGDYFLQTDYQGLNKKNPGTKGFLICLKHCIAYSLPFLLIGSIEAVLVIFITHFIIDRTNLVAYLLAMKNNVKKEVSPEGGWSFPYMYDITNFGFGHNRPFAISIWLYIISDNILHIICNYLALKYM